MNNKKGKIFNLHKKIQRGLEHVSQADAGEITSSAKSVRQCSWTLVVDAKIWLTGKNGIIYFYTMVLEISIVFSVDYTSRTYWYFFCYLIALTYNAFR